MMSQTECELKSELNFFMSDYLPDAYKDEVDRIGERFVKRSVTRDNTLYTLLMRACQ